MGSWSAIAEVLFAAILKCGGCYVLERDKKSVSSSDGIDGLEE